MDLCARPGTAAEGVFNIADPTPYTWEDLGRAAAAVLEKKLVPLRVPMRAFGSAAAIAETLSRVTGKPSPLNRSKYRDARQFGWVADVRKARDVLGFETRTPLARRDQGDDRLVRPEGKALRPKAPVISS